MVLVRWSPSIQALALQPGEKSEKLRYIATSCTASRTGSATRKGLLLLLPARPSKKRKAGTVVFIGASILSAQKAFYCRLLVATFMIFYLGFGKLWNFLRKSLATW